MNRETAPASWRKFAVRLSGRTDGAHSSLVEKLKSIGQTEVFSLGESDYLLLFCPVTTQARSDVSEALKSVPGNKPVVLVVLHHTLDHNYSVEKSRKLVNNPNVYLVVDCLFHYGRLLDCDRNVTAWSEIKTLLAIRTAQSSSETTSSSSNSFCNTKRIIAFIVGFVIGLTAVILGTQLGK